MRGTAFEVAVAADAMEVRVESGSVEVLAAAGSARRGRSGAPGGGMGAAEAGVRGPGPGEGAAGRWSRPTGAEGAGHFCREAGLASGARRRWRRESRCTVVADLVNPSGSSPWRCPLPAGVRTAPCGWRSPTRTGEVQDLAIAVPARVPGGPPARPRGTVSIPLPSAAASALPGSTRCRAMYRPEGRGPILSPALEIEVR